MASPSPLRTLIRSVPKPISQDHASAVTQLYWTAKKKAPLTPISVHNLLSLIKGKTPSEICSLAKEVKANRILVASSTYDAPISSSARLLTRTSFGSGFLLTTIKS